MVTAVLPTFIYWKLQIPLRQKVGLFFVFAFAYAAVAIGVFRAYLSWRIFFQTYDVTWAMWETILWTMLELHIGVMCANAPALKAFFQHFSTSNASRRAPSRPRARGSKRRSSRGQAKPSAVWKRSRDGYFGGPHTNVQVDEHGGIQSDAHGPPAKAVPTSDSVRTLQDSLDDADIELGDLQALPQPPPAARRERLQPLHAMP